MTGVHRKTSYRERTEGHNWVRTVWHLRCVLGEPALPRIDPHFARSLLRVLQGRACRFAPGPSGSRAKRMFDLTRSAMDAGGRRSDVRWKVVCVDVTSTPGEKEKEKSVS
ncbi:hypothetical protein C8Q76DRAFT_719503, partial [Earliella scabrosa]